MIRRRWRARRDVAARPKDGDWYDVVDLLTEATSDLGSRPMRLILTLAGTVIGVGALVATIGLSQSSSSEIARQFELASTAQAIVRPLDVATADGGSVPAGQLPWDAADRVSTLAGVASAAILSDIPLDDVAIEAVQVHDPSQARTSSPALVAASVDLLDTTKGSLISGRMFDSGHDARGDRVAVLGIRAAESFGLSDVASQPSIFIDGRSYAVIGIFDDTRYRAELLSAVVIPVGTARADFGITSPQEVQIRLDPGGGPIVADQAARAILPDEPEVLETSASRGESVLQQNVQGNLDAVFLILAIVVMLAGGFGIANVTMLSVLERTAEIGLRRALGASGRQIAGQFIVESAVLGFVGGLIGAVGGVITVVAVAVSQGWSPAVDVIVAFGGAGLGGVTGLVAGWFPARRAAGVEPVAALRTG